MHFIQAPWRARRALSLLAVAGLLALTGLLASVRPASAGPLSVSSVTATDDNGTPVTSVWTTETAWLTVTASANVGSDTLEIVDASAPNTPLVSCSNVQSCAPVPVTFAAPGKHEFIGELLAGGQVVNSFTGFFVTWDDFPVNLLIGQVGQTTVPVGQGVEMEAKTPRQLQFADWDIEVFDLTDGSLVCITGISNRCSGTVTETAATTHRFEAFVSNPASTLSQLTDIRSESEVAFVTWSNDGWQLSLTATGAAVGSSSTVTATANKDVGPTPFWIEIFDETTGQLLKVCGFGTVCSTSFTPATVGEELVAFVSALGTTLPPGSIEASSNEASVGV